MKRRQFLARSLTGLAALPLSTRAFASPAEQPEPGLSRALIGASWRGPREGSTHFAGAIEVDWGQRTARIAYALPLPTRPHGLTPQVDGGLLIIGVRPGAWIMRCDAQGRIIDRVDLDQEAGSCRLNGHAVASRDNAWLFTTETDMKTGRGRIGVRDSRTLLKQAEWDSHGLEPHQLVLDGQGQLIVANGGIPRTPADKKYDLHKMDSSLMQLDATSGQLVGQWRIDDRRLSLRHLAWSQDPASTDEARLGIAMQAEHDNPAQRQAAPALAVWDGSTLQIPTRATEAAGYAGDIAPIMAGGFVLSSNQVGRASVWHPNWPDRLTPIVKLPEPYALASWPGPGTASGALIATGPGIARWHPSAPSLLVPWPEPMALDNHWVLLAST